MHDIFFTDNNGRMNMGKERWRENWNNSNEDLYCEIKGKFDHYWDKYATTDKDKVKLIVEFAGVVWVYVKILIYAYQAGFFSVYNINPKYNTVNDSFQQKIILDICFVIIIYFCAWLNIFFSVEHKNMKVYLLLFECLVVWIFVTFPHCISIFTYIRTEYRKWLFAIFIMNAFVVFALNFLAIWMKIGHYIKYIKKGKYDIICSENEQSSFKVNFLIGFIAVSIVVVGAYIVGNLEASSNSQFKCIKSINAGGIVDESDELEYAIVYETTDKYIVCPLKLEGDNKYSLDSSSNIVISNINVVTIERNDIIRR